MSAKETVYTIYCHPNLSSIAVSDDLWQCDVAADYWPYKAQGHTKSNEKGYTWSFFTDRIRNDEIRNKSNRQILKNCYNELQWAAHIIYTSYSRWDRRVGGVVGRLLRS